MRFDTFFRAGVAACFALLAGCTEQSQELEEKVTQLRKELDRTQNELQTTQQALKASTEELTRLKTNVRSTKPEAVTVPSVSPVFPPRKELEDSYMASAKELKKALQGPLKDFTIGSFTLHNIQLSDSQFPIASSISLSLQSSDGKSYQLDFPVKADAKGKWVFPEPAEIAQRVTEAKKNAVSESSTSRGPRTEQTPNVPTTMPSSATVVIQWPDSTAPKDTAKRSESATKPPETAPRAPQTTPAPNPKQTIPADRDVLIRF